MPSVDDLVGAICHALSMSSPAPSTARIVTHSDRPQDSVTFAAERSQRAARRWTTLGRKLSSAARSSRDLSRKKWNALLGWTTNHREHTGPASCTAQGRWLRCDDTL